VSFEQIEEVVRYWWTNAEESLASARRELEAGAYLFAINRIYYAAFYGVSAALTSPSSEVILSTSWTLPG